MSLGKICDKRESVTPSVHGSEAWNRCPRNSVMEASVERRIFAGSMLAAVGGLALSRLRQHRHTMRELSTEHGTVRSGAPEELFAEAARLGIAAWRGAPGGRFSWALTGGSTPKAWYQWCTANSALTPTLLQETDWYVSDERGVPLASKESNFGNADRFLLTPNGVPPERKHPWAVQLAPEAALADFTRQVTERSGPRKGFDLCFLGLGDDAHTASLFPGSALLANDGGALFAAVEVPGKGDRLTITPSGLRACGRIVVMATGAAKAEAVHRIFRGDESVAAVPAKVLATCAGRVVWLLDEAAAAGLGAH